ncbi:hypothetical protein DL770_011001 [Monosporascus sp. CRB-9-2]|nr:hypothetical protein DL770_011001 [Monosporascus sp. CRB-9-2]
MREGKAPKPQSSPKPTRYIWDWYLSDRTAETIITALDQVFAVLESYNYKAEVIECDDELYGRKHQVRDYLHLKRNVRIEPSNRKRKLDPKAWIGYLVGYQSSNIYRIWNPLTNKVVATRDVIFDEESTFSGNLDDLRDDLLKVTEDELRYLLDKVEHLRGSRLESGPTVYEEDEEITQPLEVGSDGVAESENVVNSDEAEEPSEESDSCEPDQLYTNAYFAPYPTPDSTPPRPAALLAATIRTAAVPEERAAMSAVPRKREGIDKIPNSGVVCRTSSWEATFNAGRLSSVIGLRYGEQVDTFEHDQIKRLLQAGRKIHRRHLPPAPKTHKELRDHPMGNKFRKAEKDHLDSHKQMSSWTECDRKKADGKQLLDCMWVYVYKFDKHGNFLKCKARLVVRGDQQVHGEYENTYASTLAERSFRTLIAIAARFDLKLIQYDAVNAFVNAKLDKEIYMKMPPGYRKPGTILRLLKALYGLRESPLLWQKELSKTLTQLGFTPIPHEPCYFARNSILVFFYVDDIVIAYRKECEGAANAAISQLKMRYQLTGRDELQWFLGIKVIRNRSKRRIWLSQSSYVDKLAKLIEREPNSGRADTPIKNKELLPSQEIASDHSIKVYQKKIGSILYAAVITRPDIAFAASRLARFNMNPSPEHHAEANRLIRYLLETKYYALKYGGTDTFEVASDASFADNSIDRKSSQTYVMRLFGGTIGWRASKQDTVTTSTTEAELLALAQAAKEAMYVSRLVRELGVRLDTSTISIQCDNKQTIRLVHADIAQLQTKLRHVDIHNHWLRQEAIRGRIEVVYTPTNDMIADGLTKVLPAASFGQFTRQLGLTDIKERIQERRVRELSDKDLQKFEDNFD